MLLTLEWLQVVKKWILEELAASLRTWHSGVILSFCMSEMADFARLTWEIMSDENLSSRVIELIAKQFPGQNCNLRF